MAVATAIIGGAVVGAVATSYASSQASSAVEGAAASAADVTMQTTQQQIDEIGRQFDLQLQLLAPLIGQQYAAGGAYADLLGIGTGAQQPQGPQSYQEYLQQQQGGAAPGYADVLQPQPGGGVRVGAGPGQLEVGPQYGARGDYFADGGRGGPGGGPGFGPPGGAPGGAGPGIMTEEQWNAQQGGGPPQYPTPGSTQFQRGPQGQFVDPNLDPTRLADINTLPGQVRDTLLAGTSAEDDPYRNFIMGNQLQEGAAGTGVYGDVFQESPGYAFQVEEMERQLERVGSAGGPNIGGRAIMEAQRRAAGVANQDYYNWAGGRERDLRRLGQAEATDIGRGDQAYQNYLNRRAGDVSRLDAAAGQEDRFLATDLQRSDQAYYNYLGNLAGMASFGNPTGQAVGAAGAAGGAVAGAYGTSGANQANIYSQLGQDQANIGGGTIANYNDIIQGGIQNWMTYNASQPPPPPTPDPSSYTYGGY